MVRADRKVLNGLLTRNSWRQIFTICEVVCVINVPLWTNDGDCQLKTIGIIFKIENIFLWIRISGRKNDEWIMIPTNILSLFLSVLWEKAKERIFVCLFNVYCKHFFLWTCLNIILYSEKKMQFRQDFVLSVVNGWIYFR